MKEDFLGDANGLGMLDDLLHLLDSRSDGDQKRRRNFLQSF